MYSDSNLKPQKQNLHRAFWR